MGITRARNVRRKRRKELGKTLKLIATPPAIAGALLFGVKKRSKKKKLWK